MPTARVDLQDCSWTGTSAERHLSLLRQRAVPAKLKMCKGGPILGEDARRCTPGKKGVVMATEIRVRFHKGKLEPLEPLDLPEGEEILVTISERARPRESLVEALRATAGAWKDLVDADDLNRRIYEDRLLSARPEPRL